MRPRFSPRCAVAVVVCALGAWGGPANAQDSAALQRVTDLNKKAVEAYENLDMDEATKYLRQALELCAAEGLNNHKIKARTHIHLGIVMVGGLKQRDRGIQQFKRALEIDPSIRPTKSLVNPEIQAAFDEAMQEPGGAPGRDESSKPPEVAAEPGRPAGDDTGRHKSKGIIHTPVTEARPGGSIPIKAQIEPGLNPEKVVLAYRPEGAADYLARDMEKDARGAYVARIPAAAASGSVVSYYIEARNRAGQPLVANGSDAEPHVISLSASAGASEPAEEAPTPTVRRRARRRTDSDSASGDRKYWLGLGLGTGYGWAKGTPEVNPTDNDGHPLTFKGGFSPAQLMHFTPEVGYFIAPNLVLSLQGRLQIVTAATEVWNKSCSARKGADDVGVCPPAKGAIAFLGKATWLLGEPGPFRTFLSASAGGGEIRHLVALNLKDCGATRDQTCKDTVLGGVILLGPGAGFTYDLSGSFAFVAALNSLIGLPNPTVNFDLNVGFALAM